MNIHVTSGNATYPGYEPKPTPQLKEHQWKEAFAKKKDRWFCYVAEKEGGELAGFASEHAFANDALPYKGQLDKIHFLRDHRLA